MKISSQGQFSFVLETKAGTISLNQENNSDHLFSVMSTINKDEKNLHIFSWPGEYERGGVSTTLIDFSGSHLCPKIHTESVTIVFLNTQNISDMSSVAEKLGVADVLVFEKTEDLENDKAKKLIEEIDPRIVIFSGDESKAFAAKLSFPTQSVEEVSFTQPSFSADKTEFYTL